MFRRAALILGNPHAGGGTFATWSPTDKNAAVTLSNGNLTASWTSNKGCRSTVGKTSGKWYWELHYDSGDHGIFGIEAGGYSLATYPGGAGAGGYGYYALDGTKTPSFLAYGASYAAGVTLGFALDMDAGTLVVYKANVSQGTLVSGLTGTFYAATGAAASANVITANFGATSFTYSPPAGFNAGLY